MFRLSQITEPLSFSEVTSPSNASTSRLVLLIDSSSDATFLAESDEDSVSEATFASKLPSSKV